jgi:hypothetical protein
VTPLNAIITLGGAVLTGNNTWNAACNSFLNGQVSPNQQARARHMISCRAPHMVARHPSSHLAGTPGPRCIACEFKLGITSWLRHLVTGLTSLPFTHPACRVPAQGVPQSFCGFNTTVSAASSTIPPSLGSLSYAWSLTRWDGAVLTGPPHITAATAESTAISLAEGPLPAIGLPWYRLTLTLEGVLPAGRRLQAVAGDVALPLPPGAESVLPTAVEAGVHTLHTVPWDPAGAITRAAMGGAWWQPLLAQHPTAASGGRRRLQQSQSSVQQVLMSLQPTPKPSVSGGAWQPPPHPHQHPCSRGPAAVVAAAHAQRLHVRATAGSGTTHQAISCINNHD